MGQTSFPLISEITLDNIAEHCRYASGINKGTFEQTIFNAGGWLSRIRHGKSKMSDYHYQEMFHLLKSISGDDSASFVATMKSWYPSLNPYTTEKDIVEIIRANLEGTASDDEQSIGEFQNDISSIQFLEACLAYGSPVKSIKMAAQTGWQWFDDHKKTNLLTQLAQEEIVIQVVANPSSPVMKKIAGAMRDPSQVLRYMGLNSTLAKWHDYETAYPTITFRVSDYPILRQTLIVDFEDNSSRGLFRDYAYGSPVEVSSPHRQMLSNDPYFKYYYTEFEYLWNHGQPYEEWYATLPEPEETLKPGNYILIYPSHERCHEGSTKWIYSALSVSGNNTASVKVNIPSPSDNIESLNYWEYSYQGSLKLTRNNIFFSLYDNEHQEEINISLVRPLHEKQRFIGIMTALSPSGQQPVAFKCACIDRSFLSGLNYQILNRILSHNNKDWDDNLLVLENQDINLFYSDKIFNDRANISKSPGAEL